MPLSDNIHSQSRCLVLSQGAWLDRNRLIILNALLYVKRELFYNFFVAKDLKAADCPLQINFITFKIVISRCCDLKDAIPN